VMTHVLIMVIVVPTTKRNVLVLVTDVLETAEDILTPTTVIVILPVLTTVIVVPTTKKNV